MTRVKICGIRELEHARAALAAGAELLGFVFYRPSHRYLTAFEAHRLIAAARGEFRGDWQAVGLFVNESAAFVEQVVSECGLDLAQLSGDEGLDYCRSLRVPFLKVVRPDQYSDGEAAERMRARYWGAERVLLDAHVAGRYGGTGRALDWPTLQSAAEECLLAGGLAPDNVATAVREARPWGVDVSSGVETGRRKDPSLITRFIEEVQRADEQCEAASRR